MKSTYAKPQSDAYLAKVTEAPLKTPTNSAMALMLATLGTLDMSAPLTKLTHTPTVYAYEAQLRGQADVVKEKLLSAKLDSSRRCGSRTERLLIRNALVLLDIWIAGESETTTADGVLSPSFQIDGQSVAQSR